MDANKSTPNQQPVQSLSDTSLVVLSQAASRDNRMVLPLPDSVRVRGGAKDKLLRKLLRLGLIEDVPVSETENAWWTGEDGCRVGLRISAKGLHAIGVEKHAGAMDNAVAPADQVEASAAAPADREDSQLGHRGARASLPSSSAEEAMPNAAPQSPVRPGSKQAQLVDRLSSETGCTLEDLAKLLGWQRHTVRAALTGLRRKGFRVTKSKSEEGETRYHAFPCPTSGGVSAEGRVSEGGPA